MLGEKEQNVSIMKKWSVLLLIFDHFHFFVTLQETRPSGSNGEIFLCAAYLETHVTLNEKAAYLGR